MGTMDRIEPAGAAGDDALEPPAWQGTTTGLATGDYIGDRVPVDVPTDDLAHARFAAPPTSAGSLAAEVDGVGEVRVIAEPSDP